MQILLYLIIMSIGVTIGIKFKLAKGIEDRLGGLQSFCLYFLLAVMGYKIGVNDELLSNFHKIGYKAFLIASLCVIFSIISVKIMGVLLGGIDDR